MNGTTRRELLGGAAMLCGAASGTGAPGSLTKLPNILWLIAEDLGPTALSCYGQCAVRTPNLDRLASEGVRFDRFYTTAPVCSASRSAFMTGMYQTTIGAHHHRSHRQTPLPLPPGVRLVTGWLRDAGYASGNLGALPPTLGFAGTAKTDWNFAPGEQAFGFDAWGGIPRDRPFLAQLNFWETHRDFVAPRTADRGAIALPPYTPEHPIAREDWGRYLDSAAELDRKVGLVLQRLQDDGIADRTAVVFMGDNGEAHFRSKQFCYEEGLRVPLIIRWPPGIPRPGGLGRAGSVDHRLIEAIDLAPTFLSLTGAAAPGVMQGRAFLGALRRPPRRYAFGARDRCDETVMRLRTVRDDRFRYIRNFMPERAFLSPNAYKAAQYPVWNLLPELHRQGRLTPAQAALCAPTMPTEELYDMRRDPHQIHNLASDGDHGTKLAELRGVLERWIEATADRGRIAETPDEAR